MQTKHKYDSIIPLLFIQGKEHLLEESFRKSIPKSTVSYWLNNGYEGYYGHEYRKIFNESIELFEIYQEREHLKKVIECITKTWVGVSKIVLPILHKDKSMSTFLVNQTQFLMKTFPKKTALSFMGFNSHSFRYRINSLIACAGSPIKSCVKQNSRQLSFSEVSEIERLFANKEFAWWSMISLYYEGLRTGKLSIALPTFYKYAKLLGLSRKPIFKKERKVGLLTTAPNQYLHIDTTYWSLESGYKAAIVFASDNFSKFITGYLVAERNSAVNIYNTIKQTIKTIHKYHPDHKCLTNLVVDGGSENNNITIDELLKTCKNPSIEKLIAIKDIQYSNSPIEAVNKIYKRFIRLYKSKTFKELKRLTDAFVIMYNTRRPHGSLKGLTPLEAYENQEAVSYSKQITDGGVQRIKDNKLMICKTIC